MVTTTRQAILDAIAHSDYALNPLWLVIWQYRQRGQDFTLLELAAHLRISVAELNCRLDALTEKGMAQWAIELREPPRVKEVAR